MNTYKAVFLLDLYTVCSLLLCTLPSWAWWCCCLSVYSLHKRTAVTMMWKILLTKWPTTLVLACSHRRQLCYLCGSSMLLRWVFQCVILCIVQLVSISIHIYNYYINIRIVILLMALIYHPPFYHNRRSVHVKLHLTYGLIGHVIVVVRVALTRLFCEAFGK